jgi:hypothetical protein
MLIIILMLRYTSDQLYLCTVALLMWFFLKSNSVPIIDVRCALRSKLLVMCSDGPCVLIRCTSGPPVRPAPHGASRSSNGGPGPWTTGSTPPLPSPLTTRPRQARCGRGGGGGGGGELRNVWSDAEIDDDGEDYQERGYGEEGEGGEFTVLM